MAQVLRIHQRLIETSRGDPAVLDQGKIESAVAQPRMTFDGQALYPTLAEKAVARAFSLNKNHGFQDGNKRVSHAAMEMFLLRNGYEIEASVDEQERVFLAVADSSLTREKSTEWVKAHVVKRRL